ncbi:DNA repair protein RadA [Candidatus Woesebacteria bacterium]|nr:DNA repair protein RadA [Candidatus Woesebacteria bacterium]
MAKSKSLFVCQECGWSAPRWSGQCGSCGEWNTLVEEVSEVLTKKKVSKTQISNSLVSLPEVEALSGAKSRFSTGIGEFDRVLGGEKDNKGMVPGAVMLIGGEPGIGKSTILTQMLVEVLRSSPKSSKTDKPLMYVCGEENPSQIALRLERIAGKKLSTAQQQRLLFVTSTDVDVITTHMEKQQPALVVVDSIQTVTTSELSGVAGSVGQVRECTDKITTMAKKHHIPTFLVGHVTKDGKISGPKVLEHIVDSVLELSGERTADLRLLRAIKNRFGATDEVGVFRVREFGYESVVNPSEIFLSEDDGDVAGAATVCVMEGTRPLLLEIQALVIGSQLAMPRRVGRGIQLSRTQVMAAVLQKHCRIPLGTNDIFVSVAGGFDIKEPAIDLGLAVAMASSLSNKPIPKRTVFVGEVGLLGEIRSVNLLERRIKEAKRLGFEHIVSKKTHARVEDVLREFGLL